MTNLKYIKKILSLIVIPFFTLTIYAQIQNQSDFLRDTIITGSDPEIQLSQTTSPLDTMADNSFQRYKIDGVAAVVGQYLILESDIQKGRLEYESQMEGAHITDCELKIGRV